jgi:hypothetical protein
MQQVHLYERLTHKYADGYRYLDQDRFVATVKLTPPVMVREPDSYDDGGVFVQHLRTPAGAPLALIRQALRDTLGGSSCRHEYDCCGCASTRIFTKVLGPRHVLVRTSVSYNY